MKPVSNSARGAALALVLVASASIPVAAQERQAQQQTAADEAVEFDAGEITEAVRTPVAAAQEALNAEPVDTATALAQLQTAIPLIANDDDRFIVGQLLIDTASKMKAAGAADEQTSPLTVQGAQLSLESNRVEIARRGAFYRLLADTARASGDYPAAIAAYENTIRYAPQDYDALIFLADSQLSAGDTQAGFASADRAIQALADSGTEVPVSWISVPLNAAYEARNTEAVARYGAMLIRYHGDDAERVGDTILAYQAAGQWDDQANLDIFRLMRAMGAINQPNVYMEYIATTTQRGLPGEAQAVQNEAIAASAITAASATPTPAELTASVNEDRASLDAAAASAASAANGGPALNTGDAYAGYGQHDRALELYRLALQKGGVDAGTANLRIGAALVAAGRPDEARTALETVTGARGGLASMWIAWLDHQAGGAVAQPAAQAPATEPASQSAEPDGS